MQCHLSLFRNENITLLHTWNDPIMMMKCGVVLWPSILVYQNFLWPIKYNIIYQNSIIYVCSSVSLPYRIVRCIIPLYTISSTYRFNYDFEIFSNNEGFKLKWENSLIWIAYVVLLRSIIKNVWKCLLELLLTFYVCVCAVCCVLNFQLILNWKFCTINIAFNNVKASWIYPVKVFLIFTTPICH